MQDFDYFRAHTIDEVTSRLADDGKKVQILSGGTDLLVRMREGKQEAELLVDVKGVPELNELACDPDLGLRLGAAVPCIRILNEPAIADLYPGLIDAVSLIGSVQIQGRASVGGNLCMASPSADAVPALIVHKAACSIAGPKGFRTVPVKAFCIAPGRTVLERGEFLVALHLPPPLPRSGAGYLRFTPRNEMDIAVTGAAAWIRLSWDQAVIEESRIALATVAPTPLLAEAAGDFLIGQSPGEVAFAGAAELAQSEAMPRTSMRGTLAQRRHLVAVLVKRALRLATSRAKGEPVNAR